MRFNKGCQGIRVAESIEVISIVQKLKDIRPSPKSLIHIEIPFDEDFVCIPSTFSAN